MTRVRDIEQIDERAKHLLRTLVARYITEGTPVGSRTLSHDSGLDLSPATIRNIMSELEAGGFVMSPHTSAGRIPTAKGYRFFVDTIVRLTPPIGDQLVQLERELSLRGDDPQALAQLTSHLLSAVTHLAGVVTVPRQTHPALRQIEFLSLPDRRVLAILVINDREVQNKILDVQRDFSDSELREAANYLTEQCRGRDLYRVRNQLLEEMQTTRESMNALMIEAVELAQELLPEREPDPDLVLAGETNLMGLEELADIEKLKELFEAFSQRRDILHLLDQSLNADGVQIFIGQESGYKVLDGCSIVAAPYQTEEDTIGVLGVIGPTRMAYDRVIPIVDITAKLLGKALGARV
ncbi:MAG TPA: heat-inducible transcriptional repressor HrcA [Gammaproteobacteria bacterium]|nr:heat-inducible transcriptional repressor HrcA [Gammaproteobacteria bacterium]